MTIFGWYMWDADEEDGYSKGFFVGGSKNPVKSREEQKAYGGDHLGHIWESHPLFVRTEICHENKGRINQYTYHDLYTGNDY